MNEKISWSCEQCQAEGVVIVEYGSDVMAVVQKIDDAHKASSPPYCPNNQPGMYRNLKTGRKAKD
jgi:hypothetical protein